VLFPLDERIHEIQLEAAGYVLRHRLENPTKTQLVERDSRIKNEEITLNDEQTESRYEDATANSRLWDEIAREIAGYDLGDGSTDWRPVDDDVRSLMPVEHKSKAIIAMYVCTAEIDKARMNGHGFPLRGSSESRVRLAIGDPESPAYEMIHVLRAPTESEWTSYKNGMSRFVTVRGTRLPRYISQSNLAIAVAFYDALVSRIEGVSIEGQEFDPGRRDEFVRAIDPLHKRAVVRAFADHWSADLKN
jgi:hypothetical protein